MSSVIERIQLRRWNDSDFEAAVILNREAEEHIGMASETGDWARDMDGITETFLGSGGDFILGFLDGKLVVMGGYKLHEPHRAEVKRMRVTPDLQGHGIGTWFLKELEDKMAEAGITDVDVSTTSEQEGALRLYSGCGYNEVRRFVEDREHDFGLTIVCFEKQLAREIGPPVAYR